MLYAFIICSIAILWTRRTACNLALVQGNPFLYCLDQIWVHILVRQIRTNFETGGSTNVGSEYTNAIHFHPIFYRCIMGKKNHFYLILLKENPFFYCCLDQIWVHILVRQIPTGGSTNVVRDYTNAFILCSIHK
jgi:hypothetical protein